MSLSSNILLAAKDYVKESVITANGPEEPSLQNILTPNLWEFAEISPELRTIGFSLYFGKVKPVDIIALIGHNFLPGTRMEISFYLGRVGALQFVETREFYIGLKENSSGVWGEFSWGNFFDSTVTKNFVRNSYFPFTDSVLCSYIQVSIYVFEQSSLKSPYNYTQSLDYTAREKYRLAKLWASSIFQPSQNVNYGAEVLFLDDSSFMKAKSGTKFFETNSVRRRALNVTFEMLPKPEMMRELLGPYHMSLGKREEMLVILEPTKPETFAYSAMYGNLAEPDKASYPWWEQMSTALYVEEAL